MIAPPASRNAPCPCGTGKRYKDCHGALTPPTNAGEATSAALGTTALLDRARTALAAGDPVGAESLWRQVLEADPDNAEANFHIGNVHRESSDPRAAVSAYERALSAAPGNVAALNNLGLALETIGERERALACYRQVLTADPQQPDALGNLANALFERNDFLASANAYDRLFAIRRELPLPIVVRRGIALQRARRLEEAEALFVEATRRSPDNALLLANLGTARIELGRHVDAEQPLSRAHELNPRDPYSLSLLAHARAQACNWDGIADLFDKLRRLLDADVPDGSSTAAPLPLLAMPLSPATLLRVARRWARQFSAKSPLPPPAIERTGARLRVGFVSSDFRTHPVMHLMVELWERIDRNRLETFGYGILAEDRGPIGQRIARAFEHFADVSMEPSDAVARRIRADGVAVLFDLNGYTLNAKTEIFAMRPAPIQVNGIGYPGTLGAEWYDYIQVDRFVAPGIARNDFAERFFYMPISYFPSDTTRAPQGPLPSRADCGLPDGGFVFCCFNNAFKILPHVFATWMQLLASVPDSVLWLLEANAVARENLRREAQRFGIATQRLIFAPRVPVADHLARHAVVDLFLDTSPYGAHTTTNDALLCGVPVLTCAGETLASRIPGSQLHAIGLPELVTSSLIEYEALALSLARDPQRLEELRARLARHRQTFPLFDMARYARNFEEGLLQLWAEHPGSKLSAPLGSRR